MHALDVERLILGCGNFGGIGSLPSLKGLGENEIQARDLLNEARTIGISQFDTANTYGAGQSEEILGRWISKQEAPYRGRIRVSTKVGNPNGALSGNAPLNKGEISFHLDQSLKRLGIEQVTTYYIHEPDPSTPLEEILESLTQALTSGKIASIGLSNVDLEYVKRFLSLCDQDLRGKVRFVQNEFHFLDQRDRDELIPFLQKEGLTYIAFSPLAGGLLSGKYQLDSAPPSGSRIDLRPEPYERFMNERTFSTIAFFVRDAILRGMSPTEAALRFVLETDGISAAIIGPRRKEHFENLGLKS